MSDHIGKAAIIRTAAGHEVIYGPHASGKTVKAKQLIENDIHEDRSVWIIDLSGVALPAELDVAGDPATTIEEARSLLEAAQGIRRRGLFRKLRRLGPPTSPVAITVEGADRVLEDYVCRRLMETLLKEANKYKVTARLVVHSLDLRSFGGSKQIRAALVAEGMLRQQSINY